MSARAAFRERVAAANAASAGVTRQRWTAAEVEELARLLPAGYDEDGIALALGRSPSAVRAAIVNRGLRPDPLAPPATPETWELVRRGSARSPSAGLATVNRTGRLLLSPDDWAYLGTPARVRLYVDRARRALAVAAAAPEERDAWTVDKRHVVVRPALRALGLAPPLRGQVERRRRGDEPLLVCLLREGAA
jgi:hypothetical protein